jgi:pre-rRNA-processing protein TSR3
MPLDVLILRDPRESTKKCSLTPLRATSGVRFVNYDPERRVDAGRRLLLSPEGELLTERDRGLGLFVIDCAWRRVPTLLKTVDGELVARRLPSLVTAYPRKSIIFDDPGEGLASIEALYAALALLGEVHPELLASYHWAAQFLAANPSLPR